MSTNNIKNMLVTLIAFLLVNSFNCEDLKCNQFFQNGTETVQSTRVECRGENNKCIRVEGQGLLLENETICEFYLFIYTTFYFTNVSSVQWKINAVNNLFRHFQKVTSLLFVKVQFFFYFVLTCTLQASQFCKL